MGQGGTWAVPNTSSLENTSSSISATCRWSSGAMRSAKVSRHTGLGLFRCFDVECFWSKPFTVRVTYGSAPARSPSARTTVTESSCPRALPFPAAAAPGTVEVLRREVEREVEEEEEDRELRRSVVKGSGIRVIRSCPAAEPRGDFSDTHFPVSVRRMSFSVTRPQHMASSSEKRSLSMTCGFGAGSE